jgi:hypothetical protein
MLLCDPGRRSVVLGWQVQPPAVSSHKVRAKMSDQVETTTHYAYLHATQQAFLEGHELAFAYLCGQ